jgi:hypothetical protein
VRHSRISNTPSLDINLCGNCGLMIHLVQYVGWLHSPQRFGPISLNDPLWCEEPEPKLLVCRVCAIRGPGTPDGRIMSHGNCSGANKPGAPALEEVEAFKES